MPELTEAFCLGKNCQHAVREAQGGSFKTFRLLSSPTDFVFVFKTWLPRTKCEHRP